jgi:hypothetical protein
MKIQYKCTTGELNRFQCFNGALIRSTGDYLSHLNSLSTPIVS